MSLWSRIIRFLFGRWLRDAAGDEEHPVEYGSDEDRDLWWGRR